MSRILSRDFKYTNAASTNIRKLFARVRREQAAAKAELEAKPKAQTIPMRKVNK